MDVSKNFCDGESQLNFEMKEKYKVVCVWYVVKLLGGWYLFEILYISSTVKLLNKSYLNEGGGKVSFVKIIAWSIVV